MPRRAKGEKRPADLNLGINLLLNGSPVDAIQLDTSAAATDAIEYVVTDGAGPHCNLDPHRSHRGHASSLDCAQ